MAAVGNCKSTPFQGADGSGALQGLVNSGPQGPGGFGVRRSPLGVRGLGGSASDFCILSSAFCLLSSLDDRRDST